jgi:hypothetical protein
VKAAAVNCRKHCTTCSSVYSQVYIQCTSSRIDKLCLPSCENANCVIADECTPRSTATACIVSVFHTMICTYRVHSAQCSHYQSMSCSSTHCKIATSTLPDSATLASPTYTTMHIYTIANVHALHLQPTALSMDTAHY